MIIATAGHIDHGKSLLVKALTGVETDRLPEEKERGMSIDLGFAYQPLPSGEVLGFVDVPGHERFIRNMLAGVTGIDFAMLIIAADDGPMPQTIEHLAILNLLGVDQGVIALTKIDRVDEARRDDVTLQIQELIADTSLSEAEIMPVSAITGEGVEDLRAYLELMAESIRQRSQDGNFRLAIDRCFTLPGAGMVVTGSVFAGSVRVGDQLVLSPQGIQARVRSIHAQNRESETGTVGDRCALNLAGNDVRRNDIHRGGWLLDGVIHDPVPRFDARLHVLPGEPRSLKHWTPVHVHLGAAEVPGRVALLEGKSIAPGESGLVQIVLDRRIGALRGDGFIIRDQSAQRTMAGGRVLDPFSPARGRARPERIAVLAAMEAGSPEAALSALLKQQPAGVELSPFGTAWNLTPDTQSSLWQAVEMKTVGGEGALVGFAIEHWDELGTKILAAIKHSHDTTPEKPGLSIDAIRRSIGMRGMPVRVLEGVLSALVAEGKAVFQGASYRLPGFSAELAPKDAALWKKIEPILEDGHTRPPVVHDIAKEIGQQPAVVDRFLVRCARLGMVYQVAKNRFLLPDAIFELADIAEALGNATGAKGFGAAEFRDQSKIGRNLAIEILEYFDQAGLTWRTDNIRKLRKPVSEVFGEPPV